MCENDAYYNTMMILVSVLCLLFWGSVKRRHPTIEHIIFFLFRYAYLEDSGDDFDEEGVALTSSGVMIAADMASKLERKERKGSSSTDHVFVGVREELEEDKRE